MRELLYKDYVLKIRESSRDTDIEIMKDDELVLRITFAPGVSDEIILEGVEESLEIVDAMKSDAAPIFQMSARQLYFVWDAVYNKCFKPWVWD